MFHQSTPLRSNDNKRIQSIDLIETYDDVTKKTIKEHNPNLTEISNHPHRILITGDSGSENNKLFIWFDKPTTKVSKTSHLNNSDTVKMSMINTKSTISIQLKTRNWVKIN